MLQPGVMHGPSSKNYDLIEQLPLAIVGRIQAGLHTRIPETPKPGSTIFSRSH